MGAERFLLRRWARRGLLWAIGAGGIAAIVGSGGGGWWVDCPSSICQLFVWVEVEPPRQTTHVGQTVTFRAVDSGTVSAQHYQWCRYAPGSSTCAPIAGATGSTLTIPNVNLADDQARYEVTATASGATGRTDSAQLLVSTAPAVVFEDGEFLDLGWSWSGFVGNGQGVPSSSVSVSRPIAGGNPGAYRAVEYGPLSVGNRMSAMHVAEAATYDPGQLGAVYSIDFSAECKGLAGYGARMWVMPLLRQGARTFAAAWEHGQSCEGPGWAFDSVRGSIVASEFSEIVGGPPCGAGESCPDFSAAGAPITFGMRTVNDHVDPGPAGVASQGVDNWRVIVWRH